VNEEQSFSAVGEYFDELTRLMEAHKDSKKVAELVASKLSSEYSKDLLASLAELDGLHKEVCQILDDFSGRQIGFLRAVTVDHLILHIKFYVIEWSTMTDMIASLINKAFNLGISERDIKFGLVLRNKHVQQSDVVAILKRHSKDIDYDYFNQHRNEIVHRGRIIDKDVLDLKVERNRLYSSKYSLLAEKPIADEEFKIASTALNKKVFDMAAQKQTYYRIHYEKTLNLVSEVLRALARKTINLYEKDAI
jgi:hypothetical protein